MKNEIDSNLESRTESTEDPLKLIRSGRKYWVKDPSTLPTTYAYFSTAAKKKSVNRKNPANKLTKSRKREGHGNGIEATTQKIRRKKKGKKNGKGKGEGRKTKIFKNSTETNLNVAVDSKNPSIQKEEPKNVFPANDLSLATAPISPCNLMEEKCEHRCRDVNGTAVCVCFKGFFSAGTKCLGERQAIKIRRRPRINLFC